MDTFVWIIICALEDLGIWDDVLSVGAPLIQSYKIFLSAKLLTMFSTVFRNQDKNCSLFDNNHWKGSVATHPFVKQRPRSRRNSCPGELFCKFCTIVVLGAVLNHILKYCSQYRTTHTKFLFLINLQKLWNLN